MKKRFIAFLFAALIITSIIASAAPTTTVYITKTGHKYHADGCRFLAKSKRAITLDEAKKQGYTACSFCGPVIK